MSSLGVTALPGASMDAQDLNDLDFSPTQTPAQTRSTSPIRSHHMPHSHKEAADFFTKLNTIVEAENTSDASKAPASIGFTKATPYPAPLIAYGAISPVRNLDTQTSPLGGQRKNPIVQSTPTTLVNSEMEGYTKVNALDGSGSTSTASKIQILLIYFAFNLGLTLYNKAVMIKFLSPFLLTALHAAACVVGTSTMLAQGMFTLKHLTNRDTAMLSAFSVLYTANIAVSNVSLAMVTVPFHQTVRALTPVFTVAIYRVIFAGIYGTATYLSLIPVIVGVMLASYGDLTATRVGFFITLLGTFLAAVKTVATNRLQTAGLHFSALELLYRMSPIACLQSLFVAYLTGEFDRFDPRAFGTTGLLVLLGNGAIAFGLNVTSFEANKRSGALTMTIAANIKQVLTIILSVVLWHLPVSAMNAGGIGLTLLGGAWYGRVEMMGSRPSTDAEDLEGGEGDEEC
ncbi:MAG: hypothetical protein LQ352_002639 [Teloschistes flavicans]|nr:MAG: hypothetical protein LQ352_002639 [Teloschistes flavicans]